MTKRSSICLEVLALMGMVVVAAGAHTSAESNEVVRVMLDASQNFPDHLDPAAPRTYFRDHDPDVFFNIEAGEGWTAEGRRAAFNDFVAHMGEIDFATTTNFTCRQVAKAVAQAANFNYTNAVPSLRRLAMNATYKERYRKSAIRVAIRLGGVCPETTDFVESIVTNTAFWSIPERCEAVRVYGKTLCENSMSNVSSRAAVQMIYRNRLFHYGGMVSCDSVFDAKILGYHASSNRLEYALAALAEENTVGNARRYFDQITNLLISVDQPLPRLQIEDGAECR